MTPFTRFVLSLLTVTSLGCNSSSVDLAPPSLEFIELIPNPQASLICGSTEDTVFHLRSEDIFTFSVELEDDVALSQYKIDIHNNFDCHGHGDGATPGFSAPDLINQTEDWTILEIKPIDGTKQTMTEYLKVPANVTAGNYHFHLQVIDESGNDSPFANYYSLTILNRADTIPPTLTLSEPTTDFQISKGEAIRFQGTLQDNQPLESGGNGLLYLTYSDLSSGNTFNTMAVFPLEADTGNTYAFDFSFTVPTTLRTGLYRFSVRAQDGVRNIAEAVEFEVQVGN